MKQDHETRRKLTLNRETLIPLQNAQLDGVAGGATPTTVPIASAVALRSSWRCATAVAYSVGQIADSVSRVVEATRR